MGIPQSSSPNSKGLIILTNEDGQEKQYDTKQCCHCGVHWAIVKGSRKKRGYCNYCNDVHCGAPDCWMCRPYRKLLNEGTR